MRRYAATVLILAALAGCTAGNASEPGPVSPSYTATFAVEGENITLSLVAADEPEEWEQGLMNRETLPADGMIFLFPRVAERTFWMKNTSIPLDMLFIRDGRVLNVVEADPQPGVPADELRRYRSDAAVDTVIETRQGFSEENGIGTGTRVWIRPR